MVRAGATRRLQPGRLLEEAGAPGVLSTLWDLGLWFGVRCMPSQGSWGDKCIWLKEKEGQHYSLSVYHKMSPRSSTQGKVAPFPARMELPAGRIREPL